MPISAKNTLPTDQEARLARASRKTLAALVAQDGEAPLHFHANADHQAQLTLTLPAARLLLDILEEMGKGNGVTITPVEKQLSSQQAADFLRVSRPYLIEELLEKGKIPYRKVGNRRRIRYEDLLRYQEQEEREIARREQVMRELMAETERLGLYK
jgi:excisionase family DNA binding protein